MSEPEIRIGTRGSALALVQAGMVAEALGRQAGRSTRLVLIETDGDRRSPDTAWGEGAFVAAIERALLEGEVDIAVHSAKDVPIEQDERLRIAAYLPRADARDALVVASARSERRLVDLHPGARVGTDSPRRTGFVRALRPDLVVHPLHGNVDTRLRRLDSGETDALILACAGLDRLALGERIAERLAPDVVPPAPGQGAIAVQIRAADRETTKAAVAIDDPTTRAAVEAERWFLEACGGGCRAPVGALALLSGTHLELLAGRADPDGSWRALGRRHGPPASARAMATDLAKELLGEQARHRRGHGSATTGTSDRSSAGGSSSPRVIVTRAADQADPLLSALRERGVVPIPVPTIAIETCPPETLEAAASVERYDWIVVTSPNGARAVAAGRHHDGLVTRPRWAAVGPSTAAVLTGEGITVDFQPSRNDAGALAAELPVARGDRVLVVRGDLADPALVTGLRGRGAAVDDLVAYRTRPAPAPSRAILRDAVADGAIDGVIFTSGSTVDGFVQIADSIGLDVSAIPAVCIGPRTSRHAEQAGFSVLAVGSSRDAGALADATAAALSHRLPRSA